MKIRTSLVVSLVVLCCTGVFAQSAKDIEDKYGKTADVYSVSENLWMTPSYDAEGQVCLMRVYPKTVSPNVNNLDSYLDMDETLKFMNELFPVHTRGRREDGFGMSDLGGGTVWSRFNYKHVRFTFISTFRLTKLPDKSNEVRLDFPVDERASAEYRRLQDLKTDDQLIREHTGKPKILEVMWANRKCVNP